MAIVEMTNIMKKFEFVQAVNDGQFNLRPGEIHSIIGENGAGKTTLMRILYGLCERDSGTLVIKGNEISNKFTTQQAIDLGVGMVHQEFMLAKELTALENIILGREPRKLRYLIDQTKAYESIIKYIEAYNMQIQLEQKILNVSMGEAQRVEIIKALYRGADVLILDEPTSVLTPQESKALFSLLRNMKNDNKSIIFISHKLQEVMEISDRITVMRNGSNIITVNKSDTNPEQLAKLMVGRDVMFSVKRSSAAEVGEIVLQVEDLVVPAEKELSKLKGVSFNVRSGEILGVAGVDGNGQSELASALAGFTPVEGGRVLLDGNNITNKTPHTIRKAGLTHIPEDRNLRGVNREQSIAENLMSVEFRKNDYQKATVIKRENVIKKAVDRIKKYDIRPPVPNAPISTLSGGNTQKVVLAREVDIGGKLLMAVQPTRGVDVGAIESIHAFIKQATIKGMAVLLISADLDEILALSDRIIVMYEGRITGEVLNSGKVSEMDLGILMTGGRQKYEI